ncbi:MAG: hypothetical protein Q9N32_02880 [Gammaproteobacteria bacterium]|nr:hypothetical protein [Gammaproteobacteria bacterium]
MKPPKHLSTRIIHLDDINSSNANAITQQLYAIKGVVDVIIVAEEQVAYVKFAPDHADIDALDAFNF